MPRKPSPAVVKAFTQMSDDAEAYGAENLFLDRSQHGYVGDPREFRFSAVFARKLPTYKYELLIDYIEQYGRSPHTGLGRKLSSPEMSWMRHEASKNRTAEQHSAARQL